jgi:hypothetical protein
MALAILRNSGCVVKIAGLAALLAMVMTLMGCSTEGDKPRVTGLCPQVAIIRALDHMKTSAGSAQLLTLRGDCEYTPAGIDIAFTLGVGVEQNGAISDQTAQIMPVAVGVVNPSGRVMTAKTLDISWPLSASGDKERMTRHGAEMPLHIFLPLTDDQLPMAADYRVLVGFKDPTAQPKTPQH